MKKDRRRLDSFKVTLISYHRTQYTQNERDKMVTLLF